MSERIPPQPNGLNRSGNGKGMGVVAAPIRKKRGTNAGKEASESRTVPIRTTALNTASYAGAEQVDPDKPLTEKQRLFVKFWAQGESIRAASEKAGYGDGATYAYRMVRMPNVLRLYNEEKRLYEEAGQMTRKKVMDGFLEAIEMAKLLAEPSTMVSGWREIAKMCGYMAPVQTQVSVNVSGNIAIDRMNKMTDAELLKLITAPIEQAVGAAVEQEMIAMDEEEDGRESP